MNKLLSFKKKLCRLCKNKNLDQVLDLGRTPVGDDYQKKFDKNIDFFNLSLNKCKKCGFIQLSNVIDPEFVYGNYLYVTKTSSGLSNHFKNLVDFLNKKKIIFNNCQVLEIGSNDGTLLNYLKIKNCNVLGVDPAKDLVASINKSFKTITGSFNYKLSKKISLKYNKFNLIIANNVIANIDDLDDVFKAISFLLKTGSYFVMETFSLYGVINNNLIDNIYHEHLSYFTIEGLEKFANKYKLKLYSADHLNVKGGSIRYIFKKTNKDLIKSLSTIKNIKKEKKINLLSNKSFINIKEINFYEKNKLLEFIIREKKNKKNFDGYGASVGSTTLIYYYDLFDKINYLYDDEKKRHNLFSPGSGIQVLSPQKISINKPDFIIILAWRYCDLIIQKNNLYLEKGGKFIVPLPNFKIIEKS